MRVTEEFNVLTVHVIVLCVPLSMYYIDRILSMCVRTGIAAFKDG